MAKFFVGFVSIDGLDFLNSCFWGRLKDISQIKATIGKSKDRLARNFIYEISILYIVQIQSHISMSFLVLHEKCSLVLQKRGLDRL